MKQIKILDTTLRDGEQSPGCSMNTEEKVEVGHQLRRLGVDIIEAGFAASSEGDFESVSAVAREVRGVCVASLARCTQADIDAAAQSLKKADSPRIHLFLATSPIHMQHKLKMTSEQVTERIFNMVKYACSLVSDVQFSAEDATRSDRTFLSRAIGAAIQAGAKTVNIPDTVGYSVPTEMNALVRYVRENTPGAEKVTFSTHCHDDLGLATANTLAAIDGGATQAEVTVNGIGERAGNASLEQVVMALKTREDAYGVTTGIKTRQIYRSSHLVYSILGIPTPKNKPIVGANAFIHEAGIHQHGMMACEQTYQLISPESVGIKPENMILGKHSGRHAFEARLTELGYEPTPEQCEQLFRRFKKLCDKKKEITDSDIEAIASNKFTENSHYRLDRFDVHAGNLATPTCVIRLLKDGVMIQDVSLGDGPIDAAYNAIDKIICPPPHKLLDYSIHSISSGRDALGEVVVKIKCADSVVNGRGLSTDIIESSILAYLNAINKII